MTLRAKARAAGTAGTTPALLLRPGSSLASLLASYIWVLVLPLICMLPPTSCAYILAKPPGRG